MTVIGNIYMSDAEAAAQAPLAKRWKSSPPGPPPAHLVALTAPKAPSVPPPAHLITPAAAGAPMQDESQPIWKKFKSTSSLPNGLIICKRFNDNRKCGDICPKDLEHVCDVLLEDGTGCGSTSHCRMTHDPYCDGMPALTWS